MNRRTWLSGVTCAAVLALASRAQADPTGTQKGAGDVSLGPASTSDQGAISSGTASDVFSTTPGAPSARGAATGTTRTTAAEYDPEAGAERGLGARGPNRFLLVTGVSVLGGAYVTSAVVGALNDRDADRRLLIPILGPWADLADRQCDERPCNDKLMSATLLVASGLLQAGGAVAIIASFLAPNAPTPLELGGGATSVHIAPMRFGWAGAGLGPVGKF